MEAILSFTSGLKLLCVVLLVVGDHRVINVSAFAKNVSIVSVTSTTAASQIGTSDLSAVNVTNTTHSSDGYTTETAQTTESTTIVFNVTTTENASTTTTIEDASTTTTTTEPQPCENALFQDITKNSIARTEANISINLTLDETTCSATIEVSCTTNDTSTWVKETNYTLPMNYSSRGEFVLDNLSEFTNYTCRFTIIESGDSRQLPPFQTEEVAPSRPQNLYITDITSSSFNVTWEEPYKIPTILLGYNVTIERGNVSSPNHYWFDCSSDDSKQVYLFNEEQNFLHFQNASANFIYSVTVNAWSTAGAGVPAITNQSTLSAASDPPRNVSYNIKEDSNRTYVDMSLNVSWQLPCDTNGPVNYFILELSGYYKLNESVTDNRQFELNITYPPNKDYEYIIYDLQAAMNYMLKMYVTEDQSKGLNGTMSYSTFETPDNYPSAPEDDSLRIINSNNFTISWKEPTNRPGNITGYIVDVALSRVNWNLTDKCVLGNYPNNSFFLESGERNITATELTPDTTYHVAVAAETSRGRGQSLDLSITSIPSEPGGVQVNSSFDSQSNNELDYDVDGIVEFEPSCFNGQFVSYLISFRGTRDDNEHYDNQSITDYRNTTYRFSLKPEYSYVVNVTVINSKFNNTVKGKFAAPPGVPLFNEDGINSIEPVTGVTEATLTLKREYFSQDHGNLSYLAIIVSSENVSGGEYASWNNNSHWPKLEPPAGVKIYYQATGKFWKPFANDSVTSIDYVIGQDRSCAENTQYCNGPLRPETRYFVLVRTFNAGYYRNSQPVEFITQAASRLGMILGIIFSLLTASAIGFFAFVMWKRGYIKYVRLSGKTIAADYAQHGRNQPVIFKCRYNPEPFVRIRPVKEPDPTTEMSKEKFLDYCKYLEQNPDVLKRHWQELQEKSELAYGGFETYYSQLPENRRKNRYTNILPFDHSRVKLNEEGSDDMGSDYINASYIKGFSNQNEYIATQGPLSGTVRDFWKMVFQEDVSIVVMVARFVENKKEKCYKYFPNNHESMLFGDDMEVRCCAELHFGIYCVRTLQVQYNEAQLTVIHFQFMDWPDCGVPEGTDNLLLFCRQLKERWAIEGGMAIVHCSAGVGRTGTIIAVDILIRALQANKKISVFNTVLELRKQRKYMVQTEKQYAYIYQLVRSILEDPITEDDTNQEHLYENIQLARDESAL